MDNKILGKIFDKRVWKAAKWHSKPRDLHLMHKHERNLEFGKVQNMVA